VLRTCSSRVSDQPRSRVNSACVIRLFRIGAARGGGSGREGLRGAGRAGRRPKLCPDQLAEVESALIQGAEANGYPNDLWTLQRAAQVIQHVTGVSYHPARVWYVLRSGLGWTWQRPARRATERNDEAIQRWVKRRWPQLKKARGARTR